MHFSVAVYLFSASIAGLTISIVYQKCLNLPGCSLEIVLAMKLEKENWTNSGEEVILVELACVYANR